MAAVGPSWYEWTDAESGESFGESTLLETARRLAKEIASKPLIDKRRRQVDLYQQPGRRLLARFAPDGSVEEVAAPLEGQAQGEGRQWGIGGPGAPGETAEISGEDVLRLNKHGARKVALQQAAKQAGLPEEAAWTRYGVLVQGERVLEFAADVEAMLAKAQQLTAAGTAVELYSSRGWVCLYPEN